MIEVMKQALAALELEDMACRYEKDTTPEHISKAITAIKEALAHQQEPIAWIERDMQCDDFDPDSVTCQKPDIAADGWEWVPLYTSPPQRKPLTDEEIAIIAAACGGLASDFVVSVARAIEAKLKEKNHG